ncbi:hypothetical protein B0H11DRAFT_2219481 [Mycena galericulata]|nr:hypothetical protein B0H11DRAFT_2219481 [Mycena galericulata]
MLEELQDNVAVNVIPVCRPHHTKTDFFVLGHPHRPPQVPDRFASTPRSPLTSCSGPCFKASPASSSTPRSLRIIAAVAANIVLAPCHIKLKCTGQVFLVQFLFVSLKLFTRRHLDIPTVLLESPIASHQRRDRR